MNKRGTEFGFRDSARVHLALRTIFIILRYCGEGARDVLETIHVTHRPRSLTANLYPKFDAIAVTTANGLPNLMLAAFIAWGVVSSDRPQGRCPGLKRTYPKMLPCVHVLHMCMVKR